MSSGSGFRIALCQLGALLRAPRPRLLVALVIAQLAAGCTLDHGVAPAEVRRGRPFRDAGTITQPDASVPSCCASRELGALPRALRRLTWPELPDVRDEVDVTTDQALRDALATRSNVRVRVHGAHAGTYIVERSDVEIVLDADAYVEHVLIARSQHRVRISGGTFAGIEMMPPIDYPNGSTTAEESLMATDLMVECVTVIAPDTAFLVRGHRVAVLGADVQAERYSFIAGDAEPIQIEDLIVAHSVLRSAGPEATYRVHGVRRSVVAFTTLSNTYKHNWRVHGVSDQNYIGDSILAGTGVMIGRQPGDSLNGVWFVRNLVYYDASNGIFLADASSTSKLVVTDNVAYSDELFVPSGSHANWEVARNTTHPYEPPPSSIFQCR